MAATDKSPKTAGRVDPVVTKERMLGTESRWRRFGEPTPAGGSLKEDGTPDYGVFGPGSIAWDVLLHPATVFFQSPAQFVLQLTYKPILAGVRDWDPISRKARKGELTIFDRFDRQQRNSGIHAPMWLGDTPTARRVAQHLHNIHAKVAGDVIDIAHPELGGYQANGPREAMWAALTEMHTMLWVYENLAFRDGKAPHRLTPEQRDQYIAEVAVYCRLFDSPEGEIPTTMAELKALYEKYDDMFKPSRTMDVIPATGQSFHKIQHDSIKKNFHVSQLRIRAQLLLSQKLFRYPILGAVSGKTRRNMGIGPVKNAMAVASTKTMLPLIWLIQQPQTERHMMRLMWGPDAVKLIESARELQRQAKAGLLPDAPNRTAA
ncbi:oxygenase MpaB family protein [Streptomyces sp. NPDC006476]|uniref:oxygenase MpaB family protein n=1 Tax=Streptomyces sp. NPDC006476 TaxID=3157175 RepID=UPI0033A046FC